MDEPILKCHWERFQAHVELDRETAAKLMSPYSCSPIATLTLLSEGCANTNYKITFKNDDPPVVLRIYVRENEALFREAAIHQRVKDCVPVPALLYADGQCSFYAYPYAIFEWIEGKLLREIILAKNEKAMAQCAYDAGTYLSKLRCIRFTEGGFFNADLTVRPFRPDENYLPYVEWLLQDPIVRQSLGETLHQSVHQLVSKHAYLLPDKNEANLTHGDYDPANILVREHNSEWKIAAILDWEFAFAGSYLLDIGEMLRYSHKLPESYEMNFIAGIKTAGVALPMNWKKQAKLMDLLCLLQLAHYNPPTVRPNLNKDVTSLISHTISHWHTF
ncbi:phosphotransferase family protein [Aquicella lusitana]|uniref:Phosphotransferase family enzyme n=1 Tax=Aquicella lusitana TaxID=254246 RepID=A0A370G5F4_9COXI|nr:aminoglycoside phosphotransferase family protein [Aquicella lusitana]RDI39061.1 phosphotransferase family enzyme [Aquicella lusitana]VVC73668.1 hypothetical protein AQULUS_14150 [Aquicella lusitana]